MSKYTVIFEDPNPQQQRITVYTPTKAQALKVAEQLMEESGDHNWLHVMTNKESD